jgi:hypothetical protein
MIKEINKTFESNNINFKIKLKDSPVKDFIKEDIEVSFSLEGLNNNYNNNNNFGFTEVVQMNSGKINTTLHFPTNSMSTTVSNYSTSNSFTQPSSSSNKEKASTGEEDNFEFQTEYFIEQYFEIIEGLL